MFKMCVKIKTLMCLTLLTFEIATAQYDGEFWWLNTKLSDLRKTPPAPKFEHLTKFDTDESDKIVFRENPLKNDIKHSTHESRTGNDISVPENVQFEMHFTDKSNIVFPDRKKEDITKNHLIGKDEIKKKPDSEEDVFEFKLPGDENFIKQAHVTKSNKTVIKTQRKTNNKKATSSTWNNSILNKITTEIQQADAEAENICTTMKKAECTGAGGVVYIKSESNSRRPIFETRSVCCILPLSNEQSSKIHFRDNTEEIRRFKRSSSSTGTNQRLALMLRKYVTQKSEITTKKKKLSDSITTPDDYYDDVDPYSNIKNSNFKRPKKQKVNKYDCDDYVDDEYAGELPTPGLVGLYSDHVGSWSNGGGNTGHPGSPYGGVVSDEYDDGGTSFSYGATIDPRLDRLSAKPSVLGRPVKISTSSVQNTCDEESHTINYQSNPDFQVLQGFKLLNLVRNKSRIHRGKKSTTTERQINDGSDSKETVLVASSFESGYDEDSFDKNMQAFENCGIVANGFDEDYERGKQMGMGETAKGSHPWLALVTLTRRKQKIQCYATIVHPKAAVTAADCVHGQSPGDITLIAGAWDLKAESKENWQKRMVSFHEHYKYRPGDAAYNIAVLHWKRSLRLNTNIQPVCLSDPHAGSDCKFFGWGGYDQAIRQRSMWQKATILPPRLCNERVSSKRQTLPGDSFCASVKTRGSVTGVGGSLVCEAGNRHTAVGVAVWRDDVVVLIPAHEWVRDTVEALGLI